VVAGCFGDNPCPGKLTCPNMVCCPIGYPFNCGDQCYEREIACPVMSYTCTNENGGTSSGTCGDASLMATITEINCGMRVPDGPNNLFTLQAKGTMTGCGQNPIFINDNITTIGNITCGTWFDNGNGGCSPDSTSGPTTTTWTATQSESVSVGQSATFHVILKLAGPTGRVVATMPVVCGP
jgi:hypothetical protein